MNYSDFSNPQGGYKAGPGLATPTHAVSAYQTKPSPLVTPKYGSKGEFTDKTIYLDGVGNYHVNHFIGYFDRGPKADPKDPAILVKLNKLFYENFCDIFSKGNLAKATLEAYQHKGAKTVKFQIGGNYQPKWNSWIENIKNSFGILHPDWVAFKPEENGLSFVGSTLKRNWAEKEEIQLFSLFSYIMGKVGLIDEEGAFKFAKNLVEVNQHHFLAGRRSWAVGYDYDQRRWYVETAAFERSSQCEYNVAEKSGMMRKAITDLWVNLITNFSEYSKMSLTDIPINSKYYEVINNYEYRNKVLFKADEDKSAQNLLNKPWIAKAFARHPGLTAGL